MMIICEQAVWQVVDASRRQAAAGTDLAMAHGTVWAVVLEAMCGVEVLPGGTPFPSRRPPPAGSIAQTHEDRSGHSLHPLNSCGSRLRLVFSKV